MENKLEELKQALEKTIENSINLISDIDKLEQEKPWRELSNWHQIAWCMIFTSILHRSVWKEFEAKNLTLEQRVEYVEEAGKVTHEHIKNLYFFNTKKL